MTRGERSRRVRNHAAKGSCSILNVQAVVGRMDDSGFFMLFLPVEGVNCEGDNVNYDGWDEVFFSILNNICIFAFSTPSCWALGM